MATPLRQFAGEVTGITIVHCGHFIPDEQPKALSEAMATFFR